MDSVDDRRYSSWLGASIFSSSPEIINFLMMRQDYEENGSNFINYKSPLTIYEYERPKKKIAQQNNFNLMLKSKNIPVYFSFQ